jgi:hypothetical protein
MKRLQIRNIIAEELHHLTNEAVPANVQSFANRKGAAAKRLVKQVDAWALKTGHRVVGGTAIGKNYDTIVLDLTHQGGEVYINLNDETIEVHGEPVATFKEFEMAAMNLTNESTVNEGYGDEYSTKNVSRSDLNQLIDMLDAVDISYDLDGRGETIEFDMTELDRRQQQQVKKWLNVNESITEAKFEFIDKEDPDNKIVITDMDSYLTLVQKDFDGNKVTFTLGNSQIAPLIRVLKKHSSKTNEISMQEKKEQQAVYMAPAGRASLKRHNGKVATILSDTDGMHTIQFPDGTQLAEVPTQQLRWLK